MKNLFHSPRFVFGLVWILTATLFIWGWSRPYFAARERAHELEMQPSSPSLSPLNAQDLLAKVRAPGADVSVVNIWATWCEPCRREMPLFIQLAKRPDVRVLLVSADDPADEPAARAFLAEQGVSFETYRMGESAPAFMRAIQPSWSGALPATFFYRADGHLHSLFLGEISQAALDAKVEGLLKTP